MMKTTELKSVSDIQVVAICIEKTCRVTFPQFGEQSEIFTFTYTPDLEKCYCRNNGVTAFVHSSKLYVIPSMRSVNKILRENNFQHKGMYVPFSNWDYPQDQKQDWDALLRMQMIQRKLDFESDCEQHSNAHGYGTIPDELLAKCFEIPDSGVHVKHLYFEDDYYPVLHIFDSTAVDKIGTYCTNNGTCVFIYRNGKTYVTRNWDAVRALQDAGYKPASLFVPFSNGERISDTFQAMQWKLCNA